MAAAFAIIPTIFKPNNLLRRQPKLTISATTSNQSYLSSTNANMISSHLLHSLPTPLHPSIISPIHHILSSSSTPPTIAPSLCLAASELVGGNSNIALNTACALHLIHVVIHAHTSLINDKPLTEFSPGTELMTTDGLLALAFEIVARTPANDEEANMCLLNVLMEVTTTVAAVAAVDEEEREGKLVACAATCGVMLGGGNEEEVEKARKLGMLVGKMELAAAEVELESSFERVRAGSVRRLLHQMLLTLHLSK